MNTSCELLGSAQAHLFFRGLSPSGRWSARWPAAMLCVFGLLLASLEPTDARAATITVGPIGTPGQCSYSTVQEALTAAGATPEPDEIRIVIGTGYTNQALLLDAAGSVRIIGGYLDCTVSSGLAQHTSISGAGGASAPVLTIRRACADRVFVHLEGLDLIDGDNPLGDGGGLLIEACGQVTLTHSGIRGNRALNGAGIRFDGLEGITTSALVIGDDVRIEDNIAGLAGGGVDVVHGKLHIGGVDTVVRRNAAFAGGGLAVRGDTVTFAGIAMTSGGLGNDGIVSRNTATYGAGVHVSGTAALDARTTDAQRPVRIDHNQASNAGGALYVNGDQSLAVLYDAMLEGNQATLGGAAMVVDAGAVSIMRSTSRADTPSSDAVPCAPSLQCNLITGNGSGSAPGAVAMVLNPDTTQLSLIIFQGTRIIGNVGDSLIADGCTFGECGHPMRVIFENALIADNPGATRLLRSFFAMEFTCAGCTIVGNGTSANAPLFDSNGSIRLFNGILWEPGRDVIGGAIPASFISYDMLVHDATDFAAGLDIAVGNPRFVAPLEGDYHLAIDSPALDRASASGAASSDIDSNLRVVDLPYITNARGPLDLGAFERQFPCSEVSDSIFCHGFE